MKAENFQTKSFENDEDAFLALEKFVAKNGWAFCGAEFQGGTKDQIYHLMVARRNNGRKRYVFAATKKPPVKIAGPDGRFKDESLKGLPE